MLESKTQWTKIVLQFSARSLQFSGPSDHLCILSPSEGNIASEDSSLSDALVLEDGMLAAVCSRGQEGNREGCVSSCLTLKMEELFCVIIHSNIPVAKILGLP